MVDLNQRVGDYNGFLLIILISVILFNNFNWIIGLIIIGTVITLRMFQVEEAPNLKIERKVPGKNFKEGDEITITLRVHNRSSTEFRGEIVDNVPGDSTVWEGSNVFLTVIRPNETKELKYELKFLRRGKYEVGPIQIRHQSFGGFHEKRWDEEDYNRFVIVPVPDPVSTYTLPAEYLKSMGGIFGSKLVGDGMDFAGVREYRTGDPLRRINWKKTAQFNELHSNEFEINRTSSFIIVLDLTGESLEISDASVRAALGLADFLIGARSKVGLISLGKYVQFFEPKGGKRHLLELSQHLTTVEATTGVKNFELFSQRLKSTVEKIEKNKHEILLFSSLSNPDFVKLLGNVLVQVGKMKVLSPSAIWVPGKRTKEFDLASKIFKLRKNSIKQFLQNLGISVYEWVPELPFESSMKTWRFENR